MHKHPASSLVMVKGKWSVQITVPKELVPELNGQKQLRRSAGTTDKRAALAKRHLLEKEMYTKLEEAYLRASPFKEAVKGLLSVLHLDTDSYKIDSQTDQGTVEEILEDVQEAALHQIHGYTVGDEESEVFAAHDRPKIEAALRAVKEEASVVLGTSSKPIKLSEVANKWIASHTFGKLKTKDAAKRAIAHFIEVVGDLHISDVTKKVAHDFADSVSTTMANKTIKNRISYVSQAISYAETKGMATFNPLHGIKLSSYGKKTTRYQPFTSAELTALFALPLPPEDRLLLSILITTGARLDEAALLCWEDLKTESGIDFIDLTGSGKLVKTLGSNRMIPIPPALKFPTSVSVF